MEVEMVIEEASIEDATKADPMSNGHEGKDVGQELRMMDQMDSASHSIQPQTPNQGQDFTHKPSQEVEDTPTKPKQTPINQIKSRLPIPTSRSNSKPKPTPSPSSISFPSYTLKNNHIKTTPLNLITQPSSFPKSPRSPAPTSKTPLTSRTPNLSIRSNVSNLTRSPRSPVPPRTPNLSNKSTTSNLSKTCLTPTKLASSSSSSSRTTPSNHQLKRPKSIHNMVNETHRFTHGQIPDDLPTPVRSTTSMTNRSASKATPSKPTQSIREMLAEARKQKQKSPSKDHLSPQWGFQSIHKLIQKAHRTGRLNLGSRMMNEIPMRVYKDLIPSHSIFHPSNLTPTKLKLQAKKKEDDDEKDEKDELEEEEEKDELEEAEEEEVKWYEKVDLTYLNVALNEISELDYELGGFDCLEHLDVHHNQLSSLPSSFGLLINLVQLNLSSNKFEEFPLPLLSLVNLKELNLSNNLLKTLWKPNWDSLLKKTLSKIGKPSKSNEMKNSTNQEDPSRRISEVSLMNEEVEFFDFFPSSPSKRKKRKEKEEEEEGFHESSNPFPLLEKLYLSSNRFNSNSIFGEKAIKLPDSLIELDLSKNPLKEPIEVPKNWTELKKLKLSGCGFNDCVFRFEVDSEYDQLSDIEDQEGNGTQKGLLFENLEELDLSNNGIDSLGPLEGFFKQYCYQKRLQYVGLPNGIENLQGGSEEVLKVLVHENFLRNESRRRKAMKSAVASAPAAPLTTDTTTKTTSTGAKKEFDTIVEAVENLSLDTAQSTKPSEPTKRVTPSRYDQIKAMIENGYHSETLTLDLHAQHIQDSDIREDMIETIEKNLVQTLNLSQNLLNRIPLEWISLSSRITSLNVSRNRLSHQDLEVVKDSLNGLMELNLSGNCFEVGKELFEWISKGCKNLKKLDLSYNVLKDEEGIEKLWFLEEIDLRGNLIEELIGLVKIGNRLKELKDQEEEDDDEKEECDDELDEFVRDYKWKCIDLRDNHIVKLEPSLGFLSIDDLFVSGNRFRVPLRKVYEGSDGSKNLLKWLRSRYV
ncbi:uncharacterized protein MELLADRAFT_70140 [Melampsora larici-populina 98AG31]|uniref:Uncharacterized protein n=1 Tax=Melampsora larici-populina (strain 98AG31 / pathotype 3-4-7) TaxID=747676 RepID=F4SDS5_MELLP|nr:uncharacterized protein MELLADRAFT_70140 [Melampsora larici-populina 98AG31]EGF97201.1 hypothetical protein MELLADRAFT_70140 [Melampsora larici-populina 98AG31]